MLSSLKDSTNFSGIYWLILNLFKISRVYSSYTGGGGGGGEGFFTTAGEGFNYNEGFANSLMVWLLYWEN